MVSPKIHSLQSFTLPTQFPQQLPSTLRTLPQFPQTSQPLSSYGLPVDYSRLSTFIDPYSPFLSPFQLSGLRTLPPPRRPPPFSPRSYDTFRQQSHSFSEHSQSLRSQIASAFEPQSSLELESTNALINQRISHTELENAFRQIPGAQPSVSAAHLMELANNRMELSSRSTEIPLDRTLSSSVRMENPVQRMEFSLSGTENCVPRMDSSLCEIGNSADPPSVVSSHYALGGPVGGPVGGPDGNHVCVLSL